jgi:hypothetical protein
MRVVEIDVNGLTRVKSADNEDVNGNADLLSWLSSVFFRITDTAHAPCSPATAC